MEVVTRNLKNITFLPILRDISMNTKSYDSLAVPTLLHNSLNYSFNSKEQMNNLFSHTQIISVKTRTLRLTCNDCDFCTETVKI